MWQKNNGHTAKDEIQNHFTGYLLTAIKRGGICWEIICADEPRGGCR